MKLFKPLENGGGKKILRSDSQPGFRDTLGCHELLLGLPPIFTIPCSLHLVNQQRAILSKGAANKDRLGNTDLELYALMSQKISNTQNFLKIYKNKWIVTFWSFFLTTGNLEKNTFTFYFTSLLWWLSQTRWKTVRNKGTL